MIAAVDPAYRALGACWYFNDNQIIGLRGQVDANGRPLINLQDGLSEGAIGTLFGYPVKVAQNIPNLTASTTGGPVFGHMQTAMVKRVVNQSGVMRLNERYADNLQIGYIGYMRWDSRSNDLRAAVTVKPAAT
jgi:HK97 family phage major capsid protein